MIELDQISKYPWLNWNLFFISRSFYIATAKLIWYQLKFIGNNYFEELFYVNKKVLQTSKSANEHQEDLIWINIFSFSVFFLRWNDKYLLIIWNLEMIWCKNSWIIKEIWLNTGRWFIAGQIKICITTNYYTLGLKLPESIITMNS